MPFIVLKKQLSKANIGPGEYNVVHGVLHQEVREGAHPPLPPPACLLLWAEKCTTKLP